MVFVYRKFYLIYLGILCGLSCAYGQDSFIIPTNRVMTVDEFKLAINDNKFLNKKGETVKDKSLDKHELKIIEEALKSDNSHFAAEFDIGREISQFTGDTLIVGGGKKSGQYSQNQSKTVLTDMKAVEVEINELITNLHSGEWNKDPYTGKTFNNKAEKEAYINELEHKLSLYKEAFSEKNKDILNRYYTINTEKNAEPDILGSITSEFDMSKISDGKFMHVELDNIPNDIYLNPKLYKILERIIKPGGTIKLSISNASRRLIIPVIETTKFGPEFIQKLNAEYGTLLKLHPTYHRITFILTNN